MGGVPRWLDVVWPPQGLPRRFLLPRGLAVGQVIWWFHFAPAQMHESCCRAAYCLPPCTGIGAQPLRRGTCCGRFVFDARQKIAVQIEGMAQWMDSVRRV